MKVILLQRVKGLGEAGSTVEVAAGHARNYLIPRGLAQEATRENVARADAAQAKHDRDAARHRQQAADAAARLEGQEVIVRAKAGESGRLFGSVTAHDIAEAIAAQFAVEVDRRRLELPEPLKTVGEHPAVIRLHPGVSAQITVRIESA
jgi:large subunit ribosomal protein L9